MKFSHPACAVCRGACCEMITFPMSICRPGEDQRWLSFHGDMDGDDDSLIHLPCPCNQLTAEGTCAIYTTRPLTCRTAAAVGCDSCRMAVRARRRSQMDEIIALMPSHPIKRVIIGKVRFNRATGEVID